MLIIRRENPEFDSTWEWGQGIIEPIRNIIYIRADGDELDRIYLQFDGIPKRMDGKPMVWYGETARTIVANLT